MLPQAPDAEEGVLASFILAPREVAALCGREGIRPESFHIPANAEIFGVLCELWEQSKPVEALTISQTLRDRNKLDAVGGFPKISSLTMLLPTAANVKHYLDIVLEKHRLREIIRVCTEYAARSYDEQDALPALLDGLHGEVTALTQRRAPRQTVRDVVKEILKEITTGESDATLLKTGMEGVDGRLSLYRGDVLMITAPTSCGKSALSFQMAFQAAMRGHRIALYPLEMKQKQSLKRAIAQLSGYNAEFVRKLAINAKTEAQNQQAQKAVRDFADAASTVINMRPHMRDDLHSIEAITADIRAEHAVNPIDFIVIDYLQLIQTGKRYERRQLELASITQGLKQLAQSLDCVICVPSQVNKEGGTREAQDAENDASALIKIHADQNDAGDIHPGRVEIWKQREGARHVDLPLKFNGLLTRFEYQA